MIDHTYSTPPQPLEPRPTPKRSVVAKFALTAILAGLLLCSALTRLASAAEIEGVTFDETVTVTDTELKLHAVGLLHYRWVIKGYVAALYLGEGASPQQVFDADVPRRLELHYFYSIKGEGFGDAAEKILARNISAAEIERLGPQIQRMHAAYRDVAPGDRYALTYLPGVGTTLTFNGSALVTVEGADFADAYFRIWLGAESIDNPLKEQLLAVKAE